MKLALPVIKETSSIMTMYSHAMSNDVHEAQQVRFRPLSCGWLSKLGIRRFRGLLRPRGSLDSVTARIRFKIRYLLNGKAPSLAYSRDGARHRESGRNLHERASVYGNTR